TRGEINQTIFRRYITADRSKATLLKGVEVGRYNRREKLKQGEREWFEEEFFLANENLVALARRARLATQRITGVDERLRVVATLVAPPTYFADSTNSIALRDTSQYDLRYLLGILNSTLIQWRFKLTSTNNNVGTNELHSLPFRQIRFDSIADRELHVQMVELVQRMLDLQKRFTATRTPSDKTAMQRQIDATDRQIDQLVYELYGLTDEEIKIVEQTAS
ncbi:MAG: hypothetical protein LAO51_10480, partial [Acidobacteriia bacterium]|nr:hypothetical protein [Terriglobia bacterium]